MRSRRDPEEVGEMNDTRRAPHRSPPLPRRAAAGLLTVLAGALGCGGVGGPPTPAVPLDSATVWVHTGPDSARLRVEVARTEGQRNLGLMRRPALDAASGMLFVWDAVQPADAGFVMWRTRIPLDGAYIDSTGTVAAVVSMEPCDAVYLEDCEIYPAGVRFDAALEVNRGWFAEHGAGVGSRVVVEAP